MPDDDLVELRFRLTDGSDIGPIRYSPALTVAMLKERIVAEWPRVIIVYCAATANLLKGRFLSYSADKKMIPKSVNDVKLISAGRILENSKTIAQCRMPFGELPGGAITMHVVIQPSLAKAKTGKKIEESPKNACSCSIL